MFVNPPYKTDLGNGTERFFVRAGSRWPFSMVKKIGQKPDYYMPFPFYLAYSAAVLRDNGIEARVLDGVAMDVPIDEYYKLCEEVRPDVVVYETATPTVDYDLSVARRLKELLGCHIVMTGPHVTVLGGEIMKKHTYVDSILAGEYEFNLLALVKRLSGEKVRVPGSLIRNNGSIERTETNEKPFDLNTLPSPAWDIFPSNENMDLNAYWDNMLQYKPGIQLHASRGCPYRCNFCLFNQVMYGEGKYRTFSPTRVVDEMEYANKKLGARAAYFDDDSFTVGKKNVLEICREIKRRGLDMKWSCMGDAMATTDEMLDAMADAGCIGMKFGVESGDPDILKGIGKPLKLERALSVARRCATMGIKTHATFTFGLKGETKQSLKKTLEFAKRLDVDTIQFSITTPFPGTRYYDQLMEGGQILSTKWRDYDGSSQCLVKFDNLTHGEVEDFCTTFAGKWLRDKIKNPAWVLRQSRYMGRIFAGQGIGGCLRLAASAIGYLRS